MTNLSGSPTSVPSSRDPPGSQKQRLLESTRILRGSQESLEILSQVKLGPFSPRKPPLPTRTRDGALTSLHCQDLRGGTTPGEGAPSSLRPPHPTLPLAPREGTRQTETQA